MQHRWQRHFSYSTLRCRLSRLRGGENPSSISRELKETHPSQKTTRLADKCHFHLSCSRFDSSWFERTKDADEGGVRRNWTPKVCGGEIGKIRPKSFYSVFTHLQQCSEQCAHDQAKMKKICVSLCILIYTSSYCVRRTSSRRASPTSSVSKTPHIKFWVKFIE